MSKKYDGLIAVVGDVHGAIEKVEYVASCLKRVHEQDGLDAILLTGDIAANFLPTRRRPTHGEEFLWRQDALSVLRVLASVGVAVMWVPGNHDPRDPSKLLKYDVPPIVQNVDRRLVVVGSFVVAGLGGSPDRFGWPYEWEESEARTALMDMGKADILLTHTPAFGHCDKAVRGEHCGSTSINLASPKYGFVVCGHIHEAVGLDSSTQDNDVTLFGNAGAIGKPYPSEGFLLIGKQGDKRWIKHVDLSSGWGRVIAYDGKELTRSTEYVGF